MGHAEAAALVAEDEPEAGDAGGAHVAVAAGAVGHPLERLRADGAGVVHPGLRGGGRRRRRGGRGRRSRVAGGESTRRFEKRGELGGEGGKGPLEQTTARPENVAVGGQPSTGNCSLQERGKYVFFCSVFWHRDMLPVFKLTYSI